MVKGMYISSWKTRSGLCHRLIDWVHYFAKFSACVHMYVAACDGWEVYSVQLLNVFAFRMLRDPTIGNGILLEFPSSHSLKGFLVWNSHCFGNILIEFIDGDSHAIVTGYCLLGQWYGQYTVHSGLLRYKLVYALCEGWWGNASRCVWLMSQPCLLLMLRTLSGSTNSDAVLWPAQLHTPDVWGCRPANLLAGPIVTQYLWTETGSQTTCFTAQKHQKHSGCPTWGDI